MEKHKTFPYHPNLKSHTLQAALQSSLDFVNGTTQLTTRAMPMEPFCFPYILFYNIFYSRDVIYILPMFQWLDLTEEMFSPGIWSYIILQRRYVREAYCGLQYKALLLNSQLCSFQIQPNSGLVHESLNRSHQVRRPVVRLQLSSTLHGLQKLKAFFCEYGKVLPGY